MTRTRTVLTFDYLMPANPSPDEFLDVYHEPDDPAREIPSPQYSKEERVAHKRRESFKRCRIRNKLRALLITIQPDCYVCGKPLQVTDPTRMEDYANLVSSERKLACHECAHAVWKGKRDEYRERQVAKLFADLQKLER